MLFNSFSFAIFLPIVFILYWFVTQRRLKIQNALLLVSSYYFYACWDWRFMFLLLFSTLLDFFTGIQMQHSQDQKTKKLWFWTSVGINLGFLGIFKYYNFFAQSFSDAVWQLGWKVSPVLMDIVLPVGISFYTFHGLSYVIDVYKGKIQAERDFVDYAVFVSFFPLLVAGPIERATHLLPQIKKQRHFEYSKAVDGLRQMLWGLFKKVVIADNCATFANTIFNHSSEMTGSTLFIGAVFFAFQIYGDFSGYSDMALGIARLFGIELLRNFAYPYFSRDIAEFWRRWHISLSSWFKDYLYIPLGGSKGGKRMRIRNTFIIFIVSGFWHGANWTFLCWGFLHALFIMPSIWLQTNRNHLDIVAKGKCFPSFAELLQILFTFVLAVLAWIFFRAENIGQAFQIISSIFSPSLFTIPTFAGYGKTTLIVFIAFLILLEWMAREQNHALETFGLSWRRAFRWAFYMSLLFVLMLFGGKEQQFIYFQF